jgi:hypothetical protein
MNESENSGNRLSDDDRSARVLKSIMNMKRNNPKLSLKDDPSLRNTSLNPRYLGDSNSTSVKDIPEQVLRAEPPVQMESGVKVMVQESLAQAERIKKMRDSMKKINVSPALLQEQERMQRDFFVKQEQSQKQKDHFYLLLIAAGILGWQYLKSKA